MCDTLSLLQKKMGVAETVALVGLHREWSGQLVRLSLLESFLLRIALDGKLERPPMSRGIPMLISPLLQGYNYGGKRDFQNSDYYNGNSLIIFPIKSNGEVLDRVSRPIEDLCVSPSCRIVRFNPHTRCRHTYQWDSVCGNGQSSHHFRGSNPRLDELAVELRVPVLSLFRGPALRRSVIHHS